MTLIKVKGRKKKVRPANIITRDQWIALTTDPELCSHVRTMIFVAMLLGLRASEILGALGRLRHEAAHHARQPLSGGQAHRRHQDGRLQFVSDSSTERSRRSIQRKQQSATLQDDGHTGDATECNVAATAPDADAEQKQRQKELLAEAAKMAKRMAKEMAKETAAKGSCAHLC
jgi:hypothetical protein